MPAPQMTFILLLMDFIEPTESVIISGLASEIDVFVPISSGGL